MDTQTNPAFRLSFLSHREVLHRLHRMLPPPDEETPEAYARRDNVALFQLSQLVPASADEIELGVNYIAANTCWAHCMQQAWLHTHDPKEEERLRRQAASMGREARGYRATLLRVQAMRMKREATPASAQQADMLETASLSMLLDALPQAWQLPADQAPAPGVIDSPAAEAVSPAEAAPASAEAEAPSDAAAEPAAGTAARDTFPPPRAEPPPPRAEPLTRHRSRRQSDEDDWLKPNWAEEAERYAIMYPQRAQLIRRLGGLPKNCNFGPPEAPLVRAIVRGSSPALLALDDPATVAA